MSDDEPIFSPPFQFHRETAREAEVGDQAGEAGAGKAPDVAPEPRFSPMSLTLLPSFAGNGASSTPRPEAPPPTPAFGGRGPAKIAAAAALALSLGAGVAFWADHRDSNGAQQAQAAQSTLETLKRLSARLDQLESRSRPEEIDSRRLSADVKSSLAVTRDLNAAVASMSARLEKIDRDQSAKFEKLSERLDKDAINQLAGMGPRADRPEKHASIEVTPAPAQPAGAVAASRPPPPAPATASAKLDPGISNEPTGAIDRPRATLNGFWVMDVRDGVALLQTRDGPQEVSPGDYLPGAGRIERLERRGRSWAVVTSLGVIVSE